jgi:hypothetical protein
MQYQQVNYIDYPVRNVHKKKRKGTRFKKELSETHSIGLKNGPERFLSR